MDDKIINEINEVNDAIDSIETPAPTTDVSEAVEAAEAAKVEATEAVAEAQAAATSATEAQAEAVAAVEAASASMAAAAPMQQQAQQAVAESDSKFTPEEMNKIRQFADTIDIKDTGTVLQYGVGTQQKLAEFSESALASVKTKELGEVGDLLADLVTEIKTSGEEKKGIFGLFQSAEKKIEHKKAQFAESERNVDKIADALQDHQVILMKDIALLDKLYEKNHLYFKELSMYIEAGKIRLQQVREGELVELRKKAEQTKQPEDIQALDDLNNKCERFEKKIYDLELTRTVALQMAPQIRMVQNNDTLMSEKIQSTLVNSLPLWKSQMLLALGLAHSQEAAKTQQMVTDATNQMLVQNAETLHDATVTSAKEYERGIVDMETLKKTQASLISTIDEVIKIQDDGRAKRREAEGELRKLEDELRQKIMTAATRTIGEGTKEEPANVEDDPFDIKVEAPVVEAEPIVEAEVKPEVKVADEDPFGLHGGDN